jgi:hypothetical protein
MNNKKWAIAAIVAMIIFAIFWFGRSQKTDNEAVTSPEASSTNLAKEEILREQESNDELSDEDIPTSFEDKTDKQKEFTLKLKEMNDEIKRCQEAVNAQFPIEKLEANAPAYKNVESFKSALNVFYSAVAKKMSKTQEFMQFLETLPESEVDAKRLYRQLSEVEDCGDFEEESIVDIAITVAQDKKWPEGDKKEMVNSLIKHFRDQLNGPIGLHQVMSKVEIMRNLVDEDFIPSRYGQDLNNLQQLIDNAENDFKNNLPGDILEQKYPSSREISDMKQTENELIDKIKDPINETFSNIENAN